MMIPTGSADEKVGHCFPLVEIIIDTGKLHWGDRMRYI